MDIIKNPIFIWTGIAILVIIIIVLAVLYVTKKPVSDQTTQVTPPHSVTTEVPAVTSTTTPTTPTTTTTTVPTATTTPVPIQQPVASEQPIYQIPTSTPLPVDQPTPPPVVPDLTGMQQPSRPSLPSQPSLPQQPMRRPRPPQQTPTPTSQQPTGTSPAAASDANVWVSEHNIIRADVGQGPVTWDDTIAQSAQNYANMCVWKHDPNNHTYGENLAIMGPFSSASDKQMAMDWESEKQLYKYPSGPDSQTGHYTQIVNKNVTKIGCGCAKCPGSLLSSSIPDSKMCVCRYDYFQLGGKPPY